MADPYITGTASGGSQNTDPYIHGGTTANVPAKKSGGGGVLGKIEKYSGAQLVGNLAKDVGTTALGVGPGIYNLDKALVQSYSNVLHHPLRPGGTKPLVDIGKGTVQSYADYYGHNLPSHLYQHPLQPILDALTIASAGGGAASKLGLLSDERAALVTRSPRNIATGKGPVHVELSSPRPFVRGREKLVTAARTARPEGTLGRGGELKQYGKQEQAYATQKALSLSEPHRPFVAATHRLSADEWRALHIRAMNIHPSELKIAWKGTPNEADLTPRATELALNPSKRMLGAEPAARRFAKDLESVQPGLNEETAAARPDLTRTQLEEQLGRPVKTIPGAESYYFPHVQIPERATTPLVASGGGRGVPRELGSTRQNLGRLFFAGKLHLRGDVMGPEFLKRVTKIKYDEIHKGLRRGAVRLTPEQIKAMPGQRLPNGWGYLRTKPQLEQLEEGAEPVRVGGRIVPATLRGTSGENIPINQLIPSLENLDRSALGEGFITSNPKYAHHSGGAYYAIPESMARAATGEFTKSSAFTRNFVKRPLVVWRSAVLGLRLGFLTNNLIGNSLMYAIKTGGEGSLRNLFEAILETHGRDVAKKALDSQATPPKLRADLTREFFPDQVYGTFQTQSPAASATEAAANKAIEVGRKVTSALPKLTSKVAEEYPRRALVRYYIKKSPEFRRVYTSLPKQTRSYEVAARRILEGEGGEAYQRYISKQVNRALGDYLHMNPFERNVMRNTLPFYAWYRAITTTAYHLAVDTPLRANILGQIGRIGREQNDEAQGIFPTPSFLQYGIGLGAGPQGTQRTIPTQGLNPWATLGQLERGAVSDYTALGLNPFIEGPLQYMQRHSGNVSPVGALASPFVDLVRGLPPSRLIAPPGPSKLYPTRKGRKTQLFQFAGVPIKEYNPAVARAQAKQGR